MGAHRIAFWHAEDGASSTDAFPSLEAAAAIAGASPTGPWSAQIAAQRASPGNPGQEQDLRASRAQHADKDVHVVTFGSDATGGMVLVHGPNKAAMLAEPGAKSLLDAFLHYKTRASLQLEGSAYSGSGVQIVLSRATHRPTNKFAGIVIDVAASGEGGDGGDVEAVFEMLREAAEAAAPGARVAEVPDSGAEFGLAAGEERLGRLAWGVHLVQMFAAV